MRLLALLLALAIGNVTHAAIPGEALPSLAPVLKEVNRGVVNIQVRGTRMTDPRVEDMFRFFGNPRPPAEEQFVSVGSGVVIDADEGYVVTNAHVVANADELLVSLNDQRQFEAEVVGADPEADVALLKIEGDGLSDVTFGSSSDLEVGDFVIAIGNPFGLGQTATLGIVSATGREAFQITGGANSYQDYIQTDASINPGNSGGALITQDGKLVGINTAILSRSGGNHGIGFAIPGDTVRDLVDQLIEYGEVRRGLLGVSIQTLTPEFAEQFGIERAGGALVSQVVEGSAAEKAGIEVDDVIIEVDGDAIQSGDDLRNLIGRKRPDTEVRIKLIRDGRERNVKARLAPRDPAGQADELLDGVSLGNIPEAHSLSGQVEGVFVASVDRASRAARAGLRPNDVIISVNRKRVRNLQEFREALDEGEEDRVLLRIRRGQLANYLMIPR